MSQVQCYALVSHCGVGNLGDEATLAAAIEAIRARRPESKLLAFTLNPDDTESRHQIASYPIRPLSRKRALAAQVAIPSSECPSSARGATLSTWARRLKTNVRTTRIVQAVRTFLRQQRSILIEIQFLIDGLIRLKCVTTVVIVGGGQLGDYFGGCWGYPYTLFKWSLLGRIRGAEVIFLSVGAGPIDSKVSRWLIRHALMFAKYRSFRDQGSLQIVNSLGCPGPNHVYPDLVHGRRLEESKSTERELRTVGINPLPYYDDRYWARDDDVAYRGYLNKLVDFASAVLLDGGRIRLISTQIIADARVAVDLEQLIIARNPNLPLGSLTIPRIESEADLIEAISGTDVIVASRFHAAVLGLMVGKPSIGLSYNNKTDELLTNFGCPEFVMAIDSFDVGWLIQTYYEACRYMNELVVRIRRRSLELRRQLDEQYDRVFAHVTKPS